MPNAAQCPMANGQWPILNAKFPAPNSQRPIPNDWRWELGVGVGRCRYALKVDLRAHLEEPRRQHRLRLQPGAWAAEHRRVERLVVREHRIRVEQVVHVE